MNDKNLNQLFAAARNDASPPPPDDFAAGVVCTLRREPSAKAIVVRTVLAHLDELFPGVAMVAVAVILLCLAADWGLTAAGMPDLCDGTAQLASQFLFTAKDL